jgi:hypothetical protein
VPLEHRDEIRVQVDLALAGSQTPPCGLERDAAGGLAPLFPRELCLDVNRAGGQVEITPGVGDAGEAPRDAVRRSVWDDSDAAERVVQGDEDAEDARAVKDIPFVVA